MQSSCKLFVLLESYVHEFLEGQIYRRTNLQNQSIDMHVHEYA